MNFHKAKILLEKINRLHTNMNDDPNHISPMEKDLMLNYVREYYEIFYWDKQETAPKTTYTPPKAKPAPVVVEKPKSVVPKSKPKPEPVIVAAPKPIPKPEPIVQEVIEEVAEVVEVVSTPVKKVVVETPKPKKEPVKYEFKPAATKKTEKKSDIDPESEELFETKQATDISEKLGLSPIMDLNKAFGLNDRMLYTNELFSGDNNVYKETMAVLNSFNSLDQAKVYLIENIAGKYNWTTNSKKKQAKEFIKTISRKYV